MACTPSRTLSEEMLVSGGIVEFEGSAGGGLRLILGKVCGLPSGGCAMPVEGFVCSVVRRGWAGLAWLRKCWWVWACGLAAVLWVRVC